MLRFCWCVSKIILKESQEIPEVRVLFDRYDGLSLKSKTTEDRTSGIQIQYTIEDDTIIKNITSEKFLSHLNTKRDLTKYLSCKIAKCCQLLENDMLLPTIVLLNQTFQTNSSFIHLWKLTLWLYYILLMLPKEIHFVKYMWCVARFGTICTI